MADINQLADITIRKKAKMASHVGWPLAAIKAIEGSGIRHKPDVSRIKRSVLLELKKRGIIKRAAIR